jgi:large subunit ribosomal protein L21
MFAIIETGGKQYKVQAGTILDIETLDGQPTDQFIFDKVLLVDNSGAIKVGQPYVDGATVTATILNHVKDDKKIVFKFKPKTGYKKTAGHRQPLTTIKVDAINA